MARRTAALRDALAIVDVGGCRVCSQSHRPQQNRNRRETTRNPIQFLSRLMPPGSWPVSDRKGRLLAPCCRPPIPS
jgi:hypothetical protein